MSVHNFFLSFLIFSSISSNLYSPANENNFANADSDSDSDTDTDISEEKEVRIEENWDRGNINSKKNKESATFIIQPPSNLGYINKHETNIYQIPQQPRYQTTTFYSPVSGSIRNTVFYDESPQFLNETTYVCKHNSTSNNGSNNYMGYILIGTILAMAFGLIIYEFYYEKPLVLQSKKVVTVKKIRKHRHKKFKYGRLN